MIIHHKSMSRVWGTMASGIMFRYNGKVFLQARGRGVEDSGVWGVPGGALRGTEGFYDSKNLPDPNLDEKTVIKLWDSAIREVKEEVGVDPELSEYQFKKSEKIVYRKDNFVFLTFIVDVSEEQMKKLSYSGSQENEESDGHEWFDSTDAPDNTHPGVKYVLDVMKNKVNVSAATVKRKISKSKWTQGQIFIDEGISYDVEMLKKITADNHVYEIDVQTLIPQLYDKQAWAEGERELSPMMVIMNPTFNHTNIVHMKRIRMANLEHPIMVRHSNGRIIDGFHRVAKAFFVSKKKIKVVFVQEEQMNKAVVNS